MNIEIRIDEKYKEDKITIEASKITDELSNIINTIKSLDQVKLTVHLEDETYFINVKDIETIYSSDKKVFIKANGNEYVCKQRLYELEELLPNRDFIRISNSEIINLNKVKSINTKFIGSIVITFYSGYVTYSSRRYINKIKEILDV